MFARCAQRTRLRMRLSKGLEHSNSPRVRHWVNDDAFERFEGGQFAMRFCRS